MLPVAYLVVVVVVVGEGGGQSIHMVPLGAGIHNLSS